jgi:hypothetical protein
VVIVQPAARLSISVGICWGVSLLVARPERLNQRTG